MTIKIKCPCCDNQFVFDNSDISEGSKYEIECPKCHTLLMRKKFKTKNDKIIQQVDTTCCICGKLLPEKWQRHNAEPVRNDVCCNECNQRIVRSARGVLWRLDNQKYREMLPHIYRLPIKEIERILACENPLEEFEKAVKGV